MNSLTAARIFALFGLINGLNAFHFAQTHATPPIAARFSKKLCNVENKDFSTTLRHGNINPVMSLQSSRSTLHPGADTADLAKILAQSVFLATASSMLAHGMSSLPAASDLSAAEHSSVSPSMTTKFERSYEIRCITDGFEFSQDSGIKTAHGEQHSYRQCEALGKSELGLL